MESDCKFWAQRGWLIQPRWRKHAMATIAGYNHKAMPCCPFQVFDVIWCNYWTILDWWAAKKSHLLCKIQWCGQFEYLKSHQQISGEHVLKAQPNLCPGVRFFVDLESSEWNETPVFQRRQLENHQPSGLCPKIWSDKLRATSKPNRPTAKRSKDDAQSSDLKVYPKEQY